MLRRAASVEPGRQVLRSTLRAAPEAMLVLPATVWGFYVLAVLFVIFGLPRLFVPERSVRLQQRSYPRRVNGVLSVMGAVGLWIVSRLGYR